MIQKIDYKNSDVSWKIFAMEHVEADIIGKAVEYSQYMPQTTPEDIAQELRLKVWDSLEIYDKDKSSLHTFINRILKNCSIDLVRFHNRHKRSYICPDEDIFSTDCEDEIEEKENLFS